MTIPADHLRACPDHRLVAQHDEECPACATGIEARPDEFEENQQHPVKPLDLRWKIESDTMIELIPLITEYIEDQGADPPWVSVAELDETEMPAGYTRQERWFNVIRFASGATIKTIMTDEQARTTIENLSDEYGD